MIARYPGQCCVCGGEIVPRESEVEVHPTIVGPRGGKKMAHAECLTKSNPRGGRSVRRNGGCGCGGYGCWDGACGCGGAKSNPRGSEHASIMAALRQADAGVAQKGQAEADAFAEYQAEHAQQFGRRRRR